MGTRATFNPASREIELTEAPTAGVVGIDAITDLYSDAKEDWLASATLQKLEFPFTPAGGTALPGGNTSPKIIFLRNDLGWRILPYDDDHDLNISGNLFPAQTTLPIVTKRAGRTVLVAITTTLAGASIGGFDAVSAARIEALSLVHGLETGTSLIVTKTARTAGAVSQTITESPPGTVTVDRT